MANVNPPISRKYRTTIGRKDENSWHEIGNECGHAPDEYDDRGSVTVELVCGTDGIGPIIEEAEITDWNTDEKPEVEDLCSVWFSAPSLC